MRSRAIRLKHEWTSCKQIMGRRAEIGHPDLTPTATQARTLILGPGAIVHVGL